jgi:FAD/FMN-containing dehydrogenase
MVNDTNSTNAPNKADKKPGTYVTANRCQNQDIFFALRGGGGSTFGVNMEVSFRAHPKVTIQTADIAFIASSTAAFNSFFSVLTQNANKWADDGWGGYITFGADNQYLIGMTLFNAKLDNDNATTSIAPILDFAHSSSSSFTLAASVSTSGSFYETYQTYIQPNEDKVGVSLAIASRLIPRSVLATTVRAFSLPVSPGEMLILCSLANKL